MFAIHEKERKMAQRDAANGASDPHTPHDLADRGVV